MRRARAAVAAITLGLVGCGYYAPPIRPDRTDRPDAAEASEAPASDDAMRPTGDAAAEDSDD